MTRRAFESRLNQITVGKVKGDDSTGRAKWCLKEEFNGPILENSCVDVTPIAGMSEESLSMQVD